MNPGDLRYRVKLKNPSTVASTGFGGAVSGFTLVETVWAGIRPVTGRENMVAGQIVPEIDTIFTMRYTTNIKPASRLFHRDIEYRVVSIIDWGARNVELQVLTKRVE